MFNIKRTNIERKIPIRNIEKSVIISKSCDLTIAFKMYLPEIFNLSSRNLETLHQSFNKALQTLNPNTIVYKQDWFVASECQPGSRENGDGELIDPDRKGNVLASASERHFIGRKYRDHFCYVYITKVASKKQRDLIQSPLLKSRLVEKENLDARAFDSFLDTTSQFAEIINSSPFVTLERLTDDDLAGTREKTGLIEKYLTLEHKDNCCLMDLDFREGNMRVGDKHCKLFTLADADDMPSEVGPRIRYDAFSTHNTSYSIGMATHLGLLLDCNHMYSQYLYIIDVDEKKKALENTRNNLTALSKYSRANATNAVNVDRFLNAIHQTGQVPVRMHFNVLCWGDNKSELKAASNKVAASITKIGATPRAEDTTFGPLFWYGIPGATGDLPVEETFDGFLEEGTCMWNVETNYKTSLSPIGVKLTDRQSGVPVHIDFSDEPLQRNFITNRNKFIVGGSGSGKSFFTNHTVRHYLQQGSDVVIVDIGHSYEGLCKMMGGYYFTYTEENFIKFNPFITHDSKKPDTEKAESLKSLIIALWGKNWDPSGPKSGVNDMTQGEYNTLSDSITSYYIYLEKHPEVNPAFNTYFEFLENDFHQKLKDMKVREKDFDLTALLFVLKSFYKGGEYDYLLNAEENLDLHDQKFIVFEIDAIKDNPVLFPVVTIIIMEVFISKMRKKKGVRKVMLIEEAWKAIARAGMAEFIKYLYKTCRKYFGETWIVTQEIEDMLESPIIKKAIINNADTKIVLDLRKFMNKFEHIQSLMGLSDHEANQILSLNQHAPIERKNKEVFVSFNGAYSNVYGVEVSREEYLTFTTEETEKHQIAQLTKKLGGDYERAILTAARTVK